MKLWMDLKVFAKGSKAKLVVTLLSNPCFHSIALFRFAHNLHILHLGFLSKAVWYLNRMLYHVDIDYRAELAGGFVLLHGLGVVIGRYVKSLGSLTVYQGVTIGGSTDKTRQSDVHPHFSQPIIGAGVTVYTDAKLFGPIIIGEKAIIKAGSIITHDYSNPAINVSSFMG